jgi:hypothetical protein
MSMTNYSQSNVGASVVNKAVGHIVTDAVAAAAQTIQLGFLPRHIYFVNLTDRVTDEWFENMAEDSLQDSIRNFTAYLDADATVVDTDYHALWGEPLPVAVNLNSPPVAANVQATVIGLQKAIAGITKKLDLDTGVPMTDYFALWGSPAATLVSLKAAITGILTKLDADVLTNSDFVSKFGAAGSVVANSITISLHSPAGGASQTLEITNGISVDVDPKSATYGSFTLTATTMVASKTFYWTAEG